VREFPLDKYLASGTEYSTDKRQALVIERVGTDSTTKGTLSVQGTPVLELIVNLAPLRKNTGVAVGPLDLGDLYVVVPPETDVKFEGASGSYLRIIGKVLQLEPGEGLPSAYEARFRTQGDHYITYLYGYHDHGTDATWAADDEEEVISLTPKTIEKYVLDGLMALAKSGKTFTPRMFALTAYLDNSPLEFLFSPTLREGIDVYSLPNYNETSESEEMWSWAKYPLTVEGDHTLSLRIKNISGADQTPDSGASFRFDIWVLAKYHRAG